MRRAAGIPTRTILEAVPGRALAFLEALGTRPALRAAMADVGYGDDEHADGWRRLHDATGFGTKAPRRVPRTDARDPYADLRAWYRKRRRLLRAALLAAGTPAARTLAAHATSDLQGMLALASRLGREWNRLDAATRASLEKRGLRAAERKEVAELLDAMQSLRPGEPTAMLDPPDRTHALYTLYVWLREWTDVAHATITRRDDLIRLGIAKRRKKD